MQYSIYLDESYIVKEQFRSISAFSFLTSHKEIVKQSIVQALDSSDLSEFKWNKLKGAKYYFCAEKYLDIIFKNLYQANIRIDTLIWDTQDSRHKVEGRDDNANFERMFYHLLTNSIKRREKNSVWEVYPDQRGGVKWQTIWDCVAATGDKTVLQDSLFGQFLSSDNYEIEKFEEKCSKAEPLIQIPDLFSGMAVYSKHNYPKFSKWQRRNQHSFFPEDYQFNETEEQRFKIIEYLKNKCDINRIGVSLNSSQCLKTHNPKRPINFWFYQPQSFHDKAPTKTKK